MFKNMYFYCTYLTKTKMLSMLCTLYFLKIAKISSPQTQKIANLQKYNFVPQGITKLSYALFLFHRQGSLFSP